MKSNIGKLAVCNDGYIFEITEVRIDAHSFDVICKGIDIFSGQHRQAIKPIILSPATEKTLKEILVEA